MLVGISSDWLFPAEEIAGLGCAHEEGRSSVRSTGNWSPRTATTLF